MCALNGEAPPLPKDKSEEEFFKSKNIAFLADESDEIMACAFFRSLVAGEYSMMINVELFRLNCELFGLDIVESYGTANAMLGALNKAISDKGKMLRGDK